MKNQKYLSSLLKIYWVGIFLYFCLFVLFLSSHADSYDVLIKNTSIIDGTGKAAFRGSVAIKKERIAAVGSIKGDATLIIDGSNLVLCPGFIDPHSHADMTIMQYPLAESLVMQGVTSFLGGNCGLSPAPKKDLTFEEWIEQVETEGISVNYIPLVGHNAIRYLVMNGDYRRKAKPTEIGEMKRYIENAMDSGAFGFSVCLDGVSYGYDVGPGYYATTEEIVECAKTAQKFGGIYVPHSRGSQFNSPPDYLIPEYLCASDPYIGIYRGYLESIEIARKANIPLHIAHMVPAYRIAQPHPDFLEEAIGKATIAEIVDRARMEGIDLTFDLMPYERSVSVPGALIDSFFSKPNQTLIINYVEVIEKDEFVEHLKSKEFRIKLKKEYDSGRLKLGYPQEQYPYCMNHYIIVRCKNNAYEGKTVTEIAAMKNTDALDALFDLMIEDSETVSVSMYDPRMHPAATESIMQSPYGMPSTDEAVYPEKPNSKQIAPIAYGLFPYYINTYVKEKRILSLEEAIRKATSLPARTIGVKDRGIIQSGAYADILMFDYEKIKDRNDFTNPTVPPAGIEYVFINGTAVYEKGTHTKKKPGKVLRHEI